MKKIIIAMFVVVAGVLGFLLFTKNDAPTNDGVSNDSLSTSERVRGKSLDLSNKGLADIAKSDLNDSTVTTLNVNGNNLTGSLPGEIRKLTNLEVLDASDNDMTGVPAEVGQLSKLRILNLANNNITGLPMELGDLENLETLDLRGNPNVSLYDIGRIQAKIPNARILVD